MKDPTLSRRTVLALGAAFAGLCAGCSVFPQTEEAASSDAASEETSAGSIDRAPVEDVNSLHLRDNDELYTVYDDSGVVTMYLTVSRGNSSEGTDHSWSEINHYSVYDYEAMGVPRYQVNALLQVGDENGPVVGEVGYDEAVPNATVQIRGQTSSRYSQKNYKIKLKKNKGTWRGQRTIALNKHQQDGLRFRNKMAYDLIRGIPQMMGLRTQFVHLYVKDLTASSSARFEDYGLYTQVEQLNKTALKAHGLNSEGHLYKIEYFEFLTYDDLRLTSDPLYDQTAFEQILEVKGNSDHTKLLNMLDVLNDESQNIDTVLARYFDTENLAYWMAFQFMTGNVDTNSRNAYLYSPLNSETWYLLDWDNDAMLSRTENALSHYSEGGSWQRGISNYWGNTLFRRALQSASFRDRLDAAVNDLHQYMSRDLITQRTDHYRSIVEPFIWRVPDVVNLPVSKASYDTIVSSLPSEIEDNYQIYCDSYNYPMPFFIGVPQAENGQLKLTWDASFDFDAEDIAYTAELAHDYQFRDLLWKKTDLVLPELVVDLPRAGQYFLRVRATNTSGYTQDAFDYYVTDAGKQYGMICFYIQPDGSVLEDTYEDE